MQPSEMKYEYSATVRMHEVGPDGVAPLHCLLKSFQEAAGLHAERLSFGMDDLLKHNLVWVMARLGVTVRAFPKAGDAMLVETWPVSSVKYTAKRDFRILDGDGAELAYGGTNWVMMDVDARRMCSIPKEFQELFQRTVQQDVYEFESRKIPGLSEAAQEVDVLARLEDLDINGHVNNTHFVAWALEAVGEEHAAGQVLTGMDIQFRAEVRRGQLLHSRCAPEKEGVESLLHSLVRAEDDTEVARARTRWAGR